MKQILTILFLMFFTIINATIINIPADQPTIQAGINASVVGDTVLVQPGIYPEDINFNGKNITVTSQFLIYQDSTLIEQTLILGTGNSSVVKFENNETNVAKLNGFTITGGSGNQSKGGGIYCSDSSPTLSNLIISGNSISGTNLLQGGGIYCNNTSINIHSSKIINNTVSSNNGYCRGAGLYIYNSDEAILENLLIDNNESTSYENSRGGGIYLGESNNINFTNSTISNNLIYTNSNTEAQGGGIYLEYCDNVTFANLRVINNTVNSSESSGDSRGGGLYLSSSVNADLSDIIVNNNASIGTGTSNNCFGGGIYLASFSNSIFENIMIIGNYLSGSQASTLEGSGIYTSGGMNTFLSSEITGNYFMTESDNKGCIFANGNLILENVTLVDNSQESYGEAICITNHSVSILNSIVWNNYIELLSDTSNLIVSYCDIEGGLSSIVNNYNAPINWIGVNINQIPLFVNSATGDYHITFSSPCVDAGNPYSPHNPDGTIIDMGAYYYDQRKPIADFTADVTSGNFPLIVEFSDLSIIGNAGTSIDSWSWDFNNDGVEDSYLQNPIYTYTIPGVYTVSLTVTDNGFEDTEIKEDYIGVDQEIVVIDIQPLPGIITINEMETIDFYFSGYDPDGNPLDYSWKLDGVEVSIDSTYQFSTDYTSAGDYIIILEVTDNFGTDRISKTASRNTLNYSWDVTVHDVDQLIVINDLVPPEGSLIIDEEDVINFSIEAYDPDGNTLEYSWKLDGVEVSIDSTYDFITDYTSAGDYIVTIEVTDNSGTDRISRNVTRNTLNYLWNITVIDVDQEIVVNDIQPPTGTVTINEMESINFLIDAYDPDGNMLDCSWKLDGVEVSVDSTYLFETNYTSAGVYLVTLDVTDNFDDRNNTSRNELNYIWVVAVNNVDQEIVVNDVQPPQGTVTIDEMDTINFYFSGYDPDGIPLEYSWKLDGVEVSVDSTYLFTTDNTSAGEYLVSLEVTDNFGTERVSKGASRNTLNYSWDVTVNDVDQSIVVTELIPPEGSLVIDEEDIINFSINAYDPDGNNLEYSWQVDGEEVSIENTFDFITDENSAGDYIISLIITDNYGTRDEQTFNWDVHVNDTLSSPSTFVPQVTKLFSNHPNPFNPTTTIRFDIKENEKGTLSIFNIKGQLIESQKFESGHHNYLWNANNQSSGIYLYKLETESVIETRKMLLLK
jgi:PKD repeat protein